MGWKRTQFEKKQALKKVIKILEAKGADTSKIHMVSANADNRHYCFGCGHEKYCYETEEKAELATKFTPFEQRVYYCNLCICYHTTHKIEVADIKYLQNGFNTITVN